jgi:hypothetical protein
MVFPYARAISIVLYSTALASLLDALTTIIGIHMGMKEGVALSIEIFRGYGFAGITAFHGAIALVCAGFAFLFQHRHISAIYGPALLAISVVVFLALLLPVENNILLILEKLL